MDRRAYERMEQEIRAIHRALTGEELRVDEDATELPAGEPRPADDVIARRFVELATEARSIPDVAAELDTLAFAPAVDVLERGDELLVEAFLPGIAAHDLDVHVAQRTLFLAGARGSDGDHEGRVTVHAEIPRGPFRRVVALPCGVSARSRVEVDRGVVRIHLRKETARAADRGADAHAEE